MLAARAFALPPAAGESRFPDLGVLPAGWAAAVASAESAGLVAGFPDGTFRPADLLTRAQAAAVLLRAMPLRPFGGWPAAAAPPG